MIATIGTEVPTGPAPNRYVATSVTATRMPVRTIETHSGGTYACILRRRARPRASMMISAAMVTSPMSRVPLL